MLVIQARAWPGSDILCVCMCMCMYVCVCVCVCVCLILDAVSALIEKKSIGPLLKVLHMAIGENLLPENAKKWVSHWNHSIIFNSDRSFKTNKRFVAYWLRIRIALARSLLEQSQLMSRFLEDTWRRKHVRLQNKLCACLWDSLKFRFTRLCCVVITGRWIALHWSKSTPNMDRSSSAAYCVANSFTSSYCFARAKTLLK